jgi:hypothetical protein
MAYINFFPGNTRESRALDVDEHAHYGIEDIIGLVDSMLTGATSSAPVDLSKDALCDGSIWADLCAKHGEDAVQDALEELHALLADEGE